MIRLKFVGSVWSPKAFNDVHHLADLRRALEKLASTRVKVPPVELDGSRPKAVSGMKPRGRSRKRDID